MATYVIGFIAAVGALWLTTALHELGHVLAGGARGLRVHQLNVMGLSIRRDADGWRIVVGSLAGAGGFAAFQPPESPPADLRRTFLILIACGPLINLLFGLATFPALLQVTGSPFADHGAVAYVGALFSAINLITAVMNSLPLRIHGMATDGRQVIDLLMNPHEIESLRQRMQLSALILSSRGPEDLTPDEVAWLSDLVRQSPSDEPSAGLRLGATYALAAHELVSGRPDSARNVIAWASWPHRHAALEKMGAYRGVDILSAFLQALDPRNHAVAAHLLTTVPPRTPLRRTGLYLGTEAILALARGDHQAARKLARKGRAHARKGSRLVGFGRFEGAICEAVLQSLDRGEPLAATLPRLIVATPFDPHGATPMPVLAA